MVHCHQFPHFTRKNNRQLVFLVACQSISISMRFTELLHNWARSVDDINTYHCLLKTLRNALPPDELMLSLAALMSLRNMSRSTKPDDMESAERVQLEDVDRFLNESDPVHNTQAILRGMVWSFFRAISHAIVPDSYPSYMRFLNFTLAAISTSKQSPDRFLNHYWMKRLLCFLSHVEAMAQYETTHSHCLRLSGLPWSTSK